MKKRYFSSILLAMMVAGGYAQSSALGNQMTARLVGMEGKVVAEAHQPGNTITLTAPQHAKGVYVLQVMGQGKGASHKAKIVLR